MRWRSIFPFGVIALLPAAVLAAGVRVGPPLTTPPTPRVPLGPVEVAAPPEVTPPVAAPPIDLVLPDQAAAAAARAVPEWLAVSATTSEAHAAARSLQFTVVDMFTTVIAHSSRYNGVVPEPSTALLILFGLSGLALRKRSR